MAEHDLLKEFVQKLRAAAGENLLSVFLYGSAADGEFHPHHSDLNLLCIVRDSSFAVMAKIMPVVDWWRRQKHHAPLMMTPDEMKRSADVFSIEFTDMQQRYRLLYGEDILRGLDVPMRLHRFQLEYELREKLFLLRHQLLAAGNEEGKLWEAVLPSLSSFTTLFRHVLLEMGAGYHKHSRDVVVELSNRVQFKTAPFLQLMEVRARETDRRDLQAGRVAAQYLEAIEQVIVAVDTMQGSATQGR